MHFHRHIVVLSLALLQPAGASAAAIRVSTHEELMSALEAASGGENILLAPGNYGAIRINGAADAWASFAAPVTIVSQDAHDPAVLAGVSLSNVRNIVFKNLKFDYTYAAGDPGNLKPFIINGSSAVTIRSSVFDGDNASGTESFADGYGSGFGLFVAGCTKIDVSGNLFDNWLRGAVFAETDGLTVAHNEFRNLRSDGLDFASVQNVTIERNFIHDFRAAEKSGDHPDMIQFWTSGTGKPSVNVVIHANVLDQGAGNWTQSLFMRNELVDQRKAGREMFYRNVSITDNVIRNRHLHGITVGETEGLAIVANTLIQSVSIKEGGTISTPTIFISKSAEKVVVARNVAPKIAIPPEAKGKNWRIEGNFPVQRDYPARLDHYRQVFVNAEVEGHASLADLRLLPDSAAARAGAGSQLSQFDVRPVELDGYIQNGSVDAAGRKQEFAVPEIFGPDGAIDLGGATFLWEFGPGLVVAGNPVRHGFAGPGHYVVAVRVTLADGRSLRLSRAVVIPPA